MKRLAAFSFFLGLSLATPVFAESAPYTPQPGSPERKAIMDAMRAKGDDTNRVFVVRNLKVMGGYAWTDVQPRSTKTNDRFENESALLEYTASGWKVVDQPCGEEDCKADAELRRIRKAHPNAPTAIFPK